MSIGILHKQYVSDFLLIPSGSNIYSNTRHKKHSEGQYILFSIANTN